MEANHGHFMDLCLEEARRSLAEGNVPVGSVVVHGGEVVGVGRNRVRSENDPSAHAEVEAIRDACGRLGTWELPGTVIYTSMEPCPMCMWAIQAAGIETLVLGARHRELGRTDYGEYAAEKLLEMTGRQMEIVTGVRVQKCEEIRRSWSG